MQGVSINNWFFYPVYFKEDKQTRYTEPSRYINNVQTLTNSVNYGSFQVCFRINFRL
jgi:hypothetical protein